MSSAGGGARTQKTLVQHRFVVHEQVCAKNKRPARIYQDISLEAAAPLRFIVFRNFYSASITVKYRQDNGAWATLVGDTRLMADAHFEDDAQLWHRIRVERVRHVKDLRFYLNQPSPNWRHFGLKDIKVYTVDDVAQPPPPRSPHATSPAAAPLRRLDSVARNRVRAAAERSVDALRLVASIRETLGELNARRDKGDSLAELAANKGELSALLTR